MENLSPQMRHQLAQFQQVQQQAQALMNQRQQLEVFLQETERALTELQKLPDDAVVYKSVGTILAKSGKSKLQEDLSERKDTLNLRIKTLSRQGERAVQRLKEMREKLDQTAKESAGKAS